MRDTVLWVLCGGLLFFTLVIVGVAFMFPGNEKLYALFAGILGNFSGSLFTWLQISKRGDLDGENNRRPPQ
jgi:hypothetical protein